MEARISINNRFSEVTAMDAKDTRKLIDSINRVKQLYLSCSDKGFNSFIGKIIAGDIKIM